MKNELYMFLFKLEIFFVIVTLQFSKLILHIDLLVINSTCTNQTRVKLFHFSLSTNKSENSQNKYYYLKI